MCVEIDRHIYGSLEFGHKRCDTGGIYQTGHILEGNDFGTKSLHCLGLRHEIFVGKYLFRSNGHLGFLAEKSREESRFFGGFRGCFLLGVDGVAYSSVGYTAKLVDHAYRLLHVVEVVESVEDTHHVKTVLDSFLIETLKHTVGIRHIAEKVAATRESREQRVAFHSL